MPIINGNDKVQDFKNNPAKNKKKITSQKNQVTDGSDLYDITNPLRQRWVPWAGTGRGFRRSSRHSHVTCPKTVLWKILFFFFQRELQERETKHVVFFFFFPGGGVGWVGGATKKKKKVARPSLPKFSAEVPLNDETFSILNGTCPTPQDFRVCLLQEKPWGTNLSKHFLFG